LQQPLLSIEPTLAFLQAEACSLPSHVFENSSCIESRKAGVERTVLSLAARPARKRFLYGHGELLGSEHRYDDGERKDTRFDIPQCRLIRI
jgi:hypothetical protein